MQSVVTVMSRRGRQPIPVPEGVKLTVSVERLEVQGPRGALRVRLPSDLAVEADAGRVIVRPRPGRERVRGVKAQWGTVSALIRNALVGVTEGFEKRLELQGVGYRAEMAGDKLRLTVGFSHPVELSAPPGVSYRVEKNVVVVSGADRAAVGNAAAAVRRVRPPEPYKGKGIRYVGEAVRRKPGKTAGGATSA